GDMIWGNALDLMKLLDENKVEVLTNANPLKITETGVDVANQEGKEKTLEADTIIVATGMRSNSGIFVEKLWDKVPEVITIGDCVKPRRILHAIGEGYRRARVI
ncbi:MAG: FAD-dependent oxidoreductase, partial [Desulfobacteraceae bacterium]